MKISKWRARATRAYVEITGRDENDRPVTIRAASIYGADDNTPHPTAQDERGHYHALV